MGLKTISDHFEELGADFGEELERRVRDARLILETARKYDVPLEMLWKPSGSVASGTSSDLPANPSHHPSNVRSQTRPVP
jgi:hypothetical protein